MLLLGLCDLMLEHLLLLLLLNDAQELVSLGLGLLSKHDLVLHKLSLAGHVEVFGIFLSFDSLLAFLCTSLSLTILECTLSTESIDFTLTISSLFLKVTHSLDLFLLLVSLATLLSSLLFFFGHLVGVVLNDFQILVLLFSDLLSFAVLGNLVGDFDLSKHALVSRALGFLFFLVSLLLELNVSEHLCRFPVDLLSFLHADAFTVLDLLNDDLGAAQLSLLAKLLSFVLGLERLQTLDLHHQVQAFLLSNPFGLKLLVLFELLVTYSNDLGVEGHLVHVLNVVVFFVELLLCLGEKTVGACVLLDFNLSGGHFLGSSLVHLLHSQLASLGSCLALSFLLLLDAFILLLLGLASNDCNLLHAGDISG